MPGDEEIAEAANDKDDVDERASAAAFDDADLDDGPLDDEASDADMGDDTPSQENIDARASEPLVGELEGADEVVPVASSGAGEPAEGPPMAAAPSVDGVPGAAPAQAELAPRRPLRPAGLHR